MVIEEKTLSSTETMFFFSTPLPIRGTFLYTKTAPENFLLLNNIAETTLADTLLLTADFIYIKSTTEDVLEDLKALTLAELDDYITALPPPQNAPETNIETKIKLILKTIVAPFLQKDGGDIEFVSYNSGTVNVHFLGKCHGCPYAEKTLKTRVEKNLLRYLPEIKEAILV